MKKQENFEKKSTAEEGRMKDGANTLLFNQPIRRRKLRFVETEKEERG